MSTKDKIVHDEIPQWLRDRLGAAADRAHFESSLYGPLNSYLSIIFPVRAKYMVKPQGLLRNDANIVSTEELDFLEGIPDMPADYHASRPARPRSFPVGSDDSNQDSDSTYQYQTSSDHDNLWSTDSCGGTVESRHMAGSNTGVKYPDFLVVKATENLDGDNLVAIIEVKKMSESRYLRQSAQNQLFEYLHTAAPKRRDENLFGILVHGKEIEIYYLDSAYDDAEIVSLDNLQTEVTAPAFEQFLQALAEKHWN